MFRSVRLLVAVVAVASVSITQAALPSDDRAIAHALDRLAFGPRAGEIEKVRQMGVASWIEQQLHPERLDDSSLETQLDRFRTLAMTTAEIAREYFVPAQQAKRERKQQQAAQPADQPRPAPAPEEMRRQREVIGQLTQQKILRAVYSERQLQEVLVDFWFNHFNVFAGKGLDRILVTEYERDVIRPRVFGKFRDLLGATAESPAMLFYLDNWLSVGISQGARGPTPARSASLELFSLRGAPPPRGSRLPLGGAAGARGQRGPNPGGRRRGLNENYARELMELHTLGVDGGYTQKDIVEVARAFTGWTIGRPEAASNEAGLFRFDSPFHDPGEKIVLGHTIKAGGGKQDGEQVLDILARHPSTAKFIATKLARRFISDEPPVAVVDRAAKRFLATDGDLREVTRAIVTSPEFFAAEAGRAKVKTPFEFVVSALRATGARVQNALPLARTLQELGQPLYLCQPPTGYSDTAEAWVNTGALIARMNFAVALANNRLPGVTVDGLRDADSWLHGAVSETTRATLAKATEETQIAALTLGSPEFQRR